MDLENGLDDVLYVWWIEEINKFWGQGRTYDSEVNKESLDGSSSVVFRVFQYWGLVMSSLGEAVSLNLE